MKYALFTVSILACAGLTQADANAKKYQTQVVPVPAHPYASEVIDKVWSGKKVGFSLISTRESLIAAYYDENRQLTVAQRRIDGGPWHYRRLGVITDWDSHKYIVMTLDSAGRLHLAANMHVSPLVYFISDTGGDISSLERVPFLVKAADEQRMTYPGFLSYSNELMVFKYRDGHSGDGNEIYDVFDSLNDSWKPLLDKPVLDGEGLRNAYSVGPIKGPDNYFHLVWVWRDTPAAESNHDLSYARSKDLIHWETSGGRSLELPLTLGKAEVVDPVPVHGGIINNNTMIGFDNEGRVMITYHKFNSAGNTEVYVARREATGWHIVPVTHWSNYRWAFKGNGTLPVQIQLGGAVPLGNGLVEVGVEKLGTTTKYILNDADLSVASEHPAGESSIERVIATLPSPPAGLEVSVVQALQKSTGIQNNYFMVWTSVPANRDHPIVKVPPPSELRLITLPK